MKKLPLTRKEIAGRIGMSVRWLRRRPELEKHRIAGVSSQKKLYRHTVWGWLRELGFEIED